MSVDAKGVFWLQLHEAGFVMFCGSATPPAGSKQFTVSNSITADMLGQEACDVHGEPCIIGAYGGSAVVTIDAVNDWRADTRGLTPSDAAKHLVIEDAV